MPSTEGIAELETLLYFFKVYTDISAHIYTTAQLLHVHIASVCVLAAGWTDIAHQGRIWDFFFLRTYTRDKLLGQTLFHFEKFAPVKTDYLVLYVKNILVYLHSCCEFTDRSSIFLISRYQDISLMFVRISTGVFLFL